MLKVCRWIGYTDVKPQFFLLLQNSSKFRLWRTLLVVVEYSHIASGKTNHFQNCFCYVSSLFLLLSKRAVEYHEAIIINISFFEKNCQNFILFHQLVFKLEGSSIFFINNELHVSIIRISFLHSVSQKILQ